MPTIHIFETEDSGEIYNISQCSDKIHDGDILVCLKQDVIAIMVGAWPTSLYEYSDVPSIHFEALVPEVMWNELDGGKYKDSVKIAGAIKNYTKISESQPTYYF